MLALLAQVENQVEPFIDVKTLLLLLGLVTPFVTALAAKAGASANQKAAVSAVTIALVSLVATGLESGDMTWQKWLNGSIQILVTHVLTWVMASPLVTKVNTATADVGIVGPSSSAPADDGLGGANG